MGCYELSDKFFQMNMLAIAQKLKMSYASLVIFVSFYITKKLTNLFVFSFGIPIKTSVFIVFLKNDEMLLSIEREYCSSFDASKINLFSASESFVLGYDLDNLHKALEDIFQGKILSLVKKGTFVEFVAIEAVCKYD